MKVYFPKRDAITTAAVATAVVGLVVIAGVVFLYEMRGGFPGGASTGTGTSGTSTGSSSTSANESSTSVSSTSPSASSTTSAVSNSSTTSSASSTSTTTDTSSATTLPTPSPGAVLGNLTYCTMSGTQLQLDLYYPPSGFSPPYPLLLYVHGGGWVSGDKIAVKDTVLFGMTADGFIVGSVNYRLAPTYPFPAQIQDVKCAVRFLRANAVTLQIDKTRIGAMGSSAGGHLVSLLGVTGLGTLWSQGQWLAESSAVAGVVVVSGPENITAPVTDPAWVNAVTSAFDDNFTLKTIGSPVYHPATGAPPFLLEYGYNDTVVPYDQGIEFNKSLSSAGVSSTLILVNNAGHVLAPVNSSIPEDPPQSVTRQDIIDFFVQHLHPGAASPAVAPTPVGLPLAGIQVAILSTALSSVNAVQRRTWHRQAHRRK